MSTAQTGKYVVRAEDLPHADKLPCAQQPIKRAKFENMYAKICSTIYIRRYCRVAFPSTQILRESVSSGHSKQLFQSGLKTCYISSCCTPGKWCGIVLKDVMERGKIA